MGPSTIDHRTIEISPDLPLNFLLGCGLTPRQVAALREGAAQEDFSSEGDQPRLGSVFISYGGPDEAFATKLEKALADRGAQTFLFSKHAEPGKKLHHLMRDAINNHDRVILVCSRNSLDRSGVVNEIEEALQREAREGGASIMIPITLDDHVFTAWAGRRGLVQAIRDRVVADFRHTDQNESKFYEAVDRLLAALRNPAVPKR
jgi:predicted DCC family thiol-disulfide oxidoreductase YuxK